MSFLLHALQALGLYLLYGKISAVLWWGLLVLFVAFYLAGKTYYNVSDSDDQKVKAFWYHVRSLVFMADIVSVLALYGYFFMR